SLTNSWASQSYRASRVRQPMISMMTAKMGQPRMNAAKLRWSWATAHTTRREPISGKFRYAGSFAASWASAGSGEDARIATTTMSPKTPHRRAILRPFTDATPGYERCVVANPRPRERRLFRKSHDSFSGVFRSNGLMCQAERALASLTPRDPGDSIRGGAF